MAQGQSDSIQFILIHMKYYTLQKKRKSSSRSCTPLLRLEWPGVSYVPTLVLFLSARQELKGFLGLPIDQPAGEGPTEWEWKWLIANDSFYKPH